MAKSLLSTHHFAAIFFDFSQNRICHKSLCLQARRTAAMAVTRSSITAPANEFYVRYYVGHTGRYGHEFLEFEVQHTGKVRYANNSNYKNDTIIKKESMLRITIDILRQRRLYYRINMKNSVCVTIVVEGVAADRGRVRYFVDDKDWPEPNISGKQEIEVVMGNEHICFTTCKIGSLVDVQKSKDPDGLQMFYYLIQDLKCLIFSLIALHFKIKPI